MRVAIVGGGIAGLAAARRLEALRVDAEVVLLEREPTPGGKIVTERAGGFVIEGGPDSYLSPPTSGNTWSRRFLQEVLPLPAPREA